MNQYSMIIQWSEVDRLFLLLFPNLAITLRVAD